MFLLLLGCTFGDGSATDSDSGKRPHETDADTDTDADSDTDADTDTDTGTYEGSDISKLCERNLSKSPPSGPDCLSGELSCNSEVIATTEGGTDHFAGDDYTHNFCFTNLANHDYDAPERVYGLTVPADTVATVTLDSPCLDLDLAVLRWYDDGTCPVDDGYEICEGNDDEGDSASVEVSWDSETYWLIVVDGKYDTDVGNFRVLVSCE